MSKCKRPGSVDTSFLTQCLCYDTISALRDTDCTLSAHSDTRSAFYCPPVHAHEQRSSSLSMIGQARHTSASVVLACQIQVEGNAEVRLISAVKPVDGHVSASVHRPSPRGGQWLAANRRVGVFLVSQIGLQRKSVCVDINYSLLHLFRFLRVFIRKWAVHNWSIIFAFWKKGIMLPYSLTFINSTL